VLRNEQNSTGTRQGSMAYAVHAIMNTRGSPGRNEDVSWDVRSTFLRNLNHDLLDYTASYLSRQ
jgi:hypothetical protein